MIYTKDGKSFLVRSNYPAEQYQERNGEIILVRDSLPFETREKDGIYEITGYGLHWDQVADIGWFKESFKKGSFAGVLDDVRLKMGHDYNHVALARSPKTMTVKEDNTGLFYEASLDLRSPYAMELMVAIDRGDVDKASIGFTPGDYEYDADEDLYIMTQVLELWEISVVDFPAYSSSSVKPRNKKPTNELESLRILADSYLMEEIV